MAEGARLESVCILTGTQGSNPCLSAHININTTLTLVPGLLLRNDITRQIGCRVQPRKQRLWKGGNPIAERKRKGIFAKGI